MNKLSIFQIILLIIFGVLGVAGVLIFAFASSGNDSTSVGEVLIWGDIDSKAMDAVLQEAAATNQDLQQVTYVQKDATTYESELVNALADGSGPDLFILRQDYLLRNAGRIIPVPVESLPPAQFNALFIDAARVFLGVNGALGVPLSADPLVLYWNKDTLSAAGYAKPPATWTEVESMAEPLQQRDDGGAIKKSAIALGEYTNITNAKDMLSVLILQAGGAIMTPDNTGHLVPGLTPGANASGQTPESALRYYTQFSNPSSPHYSWSRSMPESRKAFAAGDTALYIGFASEGPEIARMNPNLNFAVAALPQFADSASVANTAHVYGISISRTTKNQLGALRVALQFGSPASGMGRNLGTVLGVPSVLRDVLALPATGTNDLYKREALISRSWFDPDPKKTSAILQAMIENITSGSFSLTDAIQRANQELSQITAL
ncbi:MAG: extracellular solute-binding protein [bacterium]|nr:extracellular solute-binding protein [bacterium]